MKFLYLFSPILSVKLVIFLSAENILFHYEDYMCFHYRYCANMPMPVSFLSKIPNLFTIKIATFLGVFSLLAELCCQILIYVKKTKIESRAQVYEMRGNQLVSHMRHQRNVVSILGHSLTFSVIFGRYLVFVTTYYIVTDKTLLINIQGLFFFMDPCLVFFICPLIETVTSSTLRDSLFTFPQL